MNTRTFCEICVEEVEAGNRPNGTLTNAAYKNISVKYRQRTGLFHNKTQLKNKWDLLKGLYSFWLGLNKDTGLGWDSNLGTVIASDEYWKKNTKVITYWLKLYCICFNFFHL